jgi:GT2 family glycosyltransferase
MTSPTVYVVVLNWNAWKETLECLGALDRIEYSNHHILVVDNGSTDGSPENISAARDDIELLTTRENLGYAGGNNAGIAHALDNGAEFVWILNNDTRVDRLALAALVEAARADPRCGVLVSRQVREDTGQQFTSAYQVENGKEVEIRCESCSSDPPYHPASAVRGPSMLLRAQPLEEVGLFDERYFHYFEDRDLGERVRRAGWTLGFVCRSVVYHAVGASLPAGSPQAQYYFLRNQLLFRQKLFGEDPLRTIARNPMLLRNGLHLRQSILTRSFRRPAAALLAIFDASRGRTGQRDLGPGFQPGLRKRRV